MSCPVDGKNGAMAVSSASFNKHHLAQDFEEWLRYKVHIISVPKIVGHASLTYRYTVGYS